MQIPPKKYNEICLALFACIRIPAREDSFVHRKSSTEPPDYPVALKYKKALTMVKAFRF